MTKKLSIKHFSSVAVVLFAILTMMTSCLNDTETTIVTYDDASITSFSIGTLKRLVYTKGTKGQDSTYTLTNSYADYLFTIDQEKNLIYNIDSLPKDVKTDRCLPTVNTLNSGYVFLKSLTSDSLSTVGADSVDFSQPRVLRCYANDGSWYRDYTVEVRVHKQAEDSLYWQQKKDNYHLAVMKQLRGLLWQDNVVAYGVYNGVGEAFMTNSKDGNTWTEITMPQQSATISMMAGGKTLYMLAGNGTLYRTENGEAWETVTENSGLAHLLAVSRCGMYALASDGGIMSSADGGATWTKETLDGAAENLPRLDVNAFTVQSRSNKDLDVVYLIGNRGVETDKTCMVWAKYDDAQNPAASGPWMFQPFTGETWHHAPAVSALCVVPYASGLLMTGGIGRDGCGLSPYKNVWFSRDGGLNWWTDSKIFLPDGFQASDTECMMVADGYGCIWIVCGGTGQVWRGFVSKYTWQ